MNVAKEATMLGIAYAIEVLVESDPTPDLIRDLNRNQDRALVHGQGQKASVQDLRRVAALAVEAATAKKRFRINGGPIPRIVVPAGLNLNQFLDLEAGKNEDTFNGSTRRSFLKLINKAISITSNLGV